MQWEYGYDESNQLISAKSSEGQTIDYNYGKISNYLKSEKVFSNYNGNKQVVYDNCVFDRFGNIEQTKNSKYIYDLKNRLIEVRRDDEISVIYSYDPLDQRIASLEKDNEKNKKTHFLMSGMVELARNVEGSFSSHTLGLDIYASRSTAGAVGAILSTKSSTSDVLFYLYDGIGNVILTRSENHDNIEKHAYEPFGGKIFGKDIPFGFSTKTSDSSKLIYYGHRYYSIHSRIWLNRDPLHEIGSLS